MTDFLKPNRWKILLTFTLFFASSALWRSYVVAHISDTFPIGFPLQFYLSWGPCPPGQVCSEFKLLFLFLDAIVWYLIGAAIVKGLTYRRTA